MVKMHLKAAKLTKSSKDWQVTTITTRHEGELILSSEFVRKSIIRDEFTNKLVTLMESAELNELEKLKAAFADLLQNLPVEEKGFATQTGTISLKASRLRIVRDTILKKREVAQPTSSSSLPKPAFELSPHTPSSFSMQCPELESAPRTFRTTGANPTARNKQLGHFYKIVQSGAARRCV